MLSYRIKTPAYYHAKSVKERLYFLSGIPERFWSTTQIQLSSFSATNDDNSISKISLKFQQEYFKNLVDNPKSKDTVCIASSPTDTHALAGASIIAKRAVDLELICEMIDLGNQIRLEKAPDVIIIHNITEDSTWDRFQLARDWLSRYDGSLTVIVAATANPISFVKKLRKDVDQILFSNNKFISKTIST